MLASSGHRGKTKRFGFRSIGLVVVFGCKTFQIVDVRSGLPGCNALESKLWVSAISSSIFGMLKIGIAGLAALGVLWVSSDSPKEKIWSY